MHIPRRIRDLQNILFTKAHEVSESKEKSVENWPCDRVLRVVATWPFDEWYLVFCYVFEKYVFYWSLVCASMGRWWVKSACRRRSVQSTGPWSAACPLRPWSVQAPRPKNVRQALSCDRVELNLSTGMGQKQFFPYRWFNRQVCGEEGI